MASAEEWTDFETTIELEGRSALYLRYEGSDRTELLEIVFSETEQENIYTLGFEVDY